MKMLKVLLSLVVAALTAMAPSAHAQGIPTIDIASITQMLQQYQVLQSQYSQLQQMTSMATGSRGLGNIFNDPSIQSQLPGDWQSVLSSVQSSPAFASERAKYPTVSTSPKANAMYDQVAAQNVTMSTYFGQATARLANIQNLMGQINLASDPAGKADLQARLINEQNAIQGTTQLLGVIRSKQKQDLDSANNAAAKELRCQEFKHTDC
jgi:type IV secretion system protein VirB5